MYKLLLCWRYLRTRYLALVCIVSVMLGVATLIVVNSVMSGFSTKLRDRLHGLLSDVVVEADGYYGMRDAGKKMELIRSDPFLAGRIEAMTPTLEIFAMLQFHFRDDARFINEPLLRPVRLIGIDFEGRKKLGGFEKYLVKDGGASGSFALSEEAWKRYRDNRRRAGPRRSVWDALPPPGPGEPPAPAPVEPEAQEESPEGLIGGYAIFNFRRRDAKADDPNPDVCMLYPGDDVVVTTVNGAKLAPVTARFALSGFIKTEMTEQDANYVFVPLDYLQKVRTMEGRATSIQIRLKDYDADKAAVVDRLRALLGADPDGLEVLTWEQKQGALLGAISIEKGILNVLLFMIIAVAGFGILAIFTMIVVEKTRDIGILKALGASNAGVLKIFLGYGLLLGVLGAGFGTSLGLAFTHYINEIEKWLGKLTGQELFDRSIYYFSEIPTNIQPGHVLLINLGAVGIAVAFSILPALRAAWLHPVRALRYE